MKCFMQMKPYYRVLCLMYTKESIFDVSFFNLFAKCKPLRDITCSARSYFIDNVHLWTFISRHFFCGTCSWHWKANRKFFLVFLFSFFVVFG